MNIDTVILDWAGTAVDFGSFAPVNALRFAFNAYGINPTDDEIRLPMGLAKRDHVKTMLSGVRLSSDWENINGNSFTEKDIDGIYEKFEPALFKTLPNHAAPLPGVLAVVEWLRMKGIKIGSTTGYTREMMDIIVPLAKKCGYSPDFIACPDDVGNMGRPYPYMLWQNLRMLKCTSVKKVLKIGDTAADMEEGHAAGCLCVGVIKGSSLLGLSQTEYDNLNNIDKNSLYAKVRQIYNKAGADFVINEITDLPTLIEIIGG